MKKTVPLTLGPGGQQIGEALVDLDDPYGVVTMRFSDARAAEALADALLNKSVDGFSYGIKPDAVSMSPIEKLPEEIPRDTLEIKEHLGFRGLARDEEEYNP